MQSLDFVYDKFRDYPHPYNCSSVQNPLTSLPHAYSTSCYICGRKYDIEHVSLCASLYKIIPVVQINADYYVPQTRLCDVMHPGKVKSLEKYVIPKLFDDELVGKKIIEIDHRHPSWKLIPDLLKDEDSSVTFMLYSVYKNKIERIVPEVQFVLIDTIL